MVREVVSKIFTTIYRYWVMHLALLMSLALSKYDGTFICAGGRNMTPKAGPRKGHISMAD